jgi:hypothetical protein
MNVPVRKGMLLRHQGRAFFVEDVKEHHRGNQQEMFHVALFIKTGDIVRIDTRTREYLGKVHT